MNPRILVSCRDLFIVLVFKPAPRYNIFALYRFKKDPSNLNELKSDTGILRSVVTIV